MKNRSRNKYILAMYDIRGKQEYIYKSTKMKEIVGASYIIRDCFDDYLYPAAKKFSEKGLFNYQAENGDTAFSEKNFKEHLKNGYLGEVVYNGGGNFFVLYKDKDVYRWVNQLFYRDLLEGTYSLRVLTSYIEGVDFNNYKEDQRKLYEVHRRREQKESSLPPVNTLPIVQVDYRSFMPLAEMQNIAGKDRKVSYESKCKYAKYEKIMKGLSKDRIIEGERILDDIVTRRGEESLLAVIYIDGNNMGARVEACLKGKDSSYETSANALRDFSSSIQKYYIDNRIKNVDSLLDEKEVQNRRFVVYAGDEITFICNARYAYDIAKEYLEKLPADKPEDASRTSCAGISIFHSHVPFSEAYRIAEECCESGKQLMKKENIVNASLIDYHYCQGAIGTSLENIREQEENIDLSRPWFIKYEKNIKNEENGLIRGQYVTGEIVAEMNEQLQKAGRGNIKNLMFSAKKSDADFLMELERIKAHQMEKKIDFTLDGKLDVKMQRKLIYDIATVYDLWFRKK